MPLEMLLTAEERAATSLTAIQENQGNIGARVFARGDAAFLGVSQPTVAVGVASYSHLATGVAPVTEDEGDRRQSDCRHHYHGNVDTGADWRSISFRH